MFKKKLPIIALLAALALCAVFMTACGDMTDDKTTASDEQTTTAAENSTAARNATIAGESRNYGSYYVYYPNTARDGLMKDEVNYMKDHADDFVSKIKESLSELAARSDADYAPLASDDKNINSVKLDEQGVLVIDFDSSFYDSIADMKMPDNAAIYGLVNTLAQYSEIRSVKFTVDGKPMVWQDEEFSTPITENTQISIERNME